MGELRFRPLLALFVTAALTVMLIMSRGMIKSMQPYVVKIFVSILLFLGLLSMLLIYFTRKQYSFKHASSHTGEHSDSEAIIESSVHTGLDFYLSKHAVKLAIYIFGTASIAGNMLYFVNDLSCLPVYILHYKSAKSSLIEFFVTHNDNHQQHPAFSMPDLASRLVLTFLEVTFFIACIAFLCQMLKVKSRIRDCWTHQLILMIISASIGVWIYTFFRETGLLNVEPKEDSHYITDNFTLACSNGSTPVDVYNSDLEAILYPFNMEFALACLEVLLHVWFLNVEINDTPHEEVDYIPTTPHPPDRSQPVPLLLKLWGKLLSLNTMNTALFFGTLEIVAIKFFLIISNYMDEHPDYISQGQVALYIECPTLIIRIFCNHVPALIVTCHCYMVTKTYEVRRRGAQLLNATYIILGIAVIAVIMTSFFDIIIVLYKFVSDDEDPHLIGVEFSHTLNFIESVLYTPQFILQAVFIYLGKTYISTERHQLHYTIEGLINYLAMFNFFRWGINSFLESAFKGQRIDLNETPEDMRDSWEALVHLCIPAVIYFHYLCTFLLLEVKYLIRFDKDPEPVDLGRSLGQVGGNVEPELNEEPELLLQEPEYQAYVTSSQTQPLIRGNEAFQGGYGSINM